MDDISNVTMTAKVSDFGTRAPSGTSSGMYQVKVLDYQDGRAVLDVDGRTVTAESKAPLQINGTYNVLIKGVNGGNVQLQIVTPDGQAPSRPLTDEALSSRFMGFDIPVTETSLQTARSLMREGMPVTRQNMLDIFNHLPAEPKPNEIDFLVALSREKLPLSRDILEYLPTMAKETNELPSAMQKVFADALKSLQPLPTAPTEAESTTAPAPAAPSATDALRALVALMAEPESDTPGTLAEKISTFARNFLQSAEAKLATVAEMAATLPPAEAEPAAALGDNLLTLLTLSEQEPQPSSAPALEQSIRNVLANMEKIQVPQDSPFAAIRDEAAAQIRASLDSGMPPAQILESVREPVRQAMAQWLETMAAGAPKEAPPAVLPQAMRMPEHLEAVMREVQTLQSLLESEGMQSAATRVAVQRLASDLLPLMSLRPSLETFPATNTFLDETARWLANILKNASANAPASATTTTERAEPQQTAPAPQPPTQTPALRDEIRAIMNLLRDTPDVRAVASEAARSAPTPELATTVTQMSRGMESAAAGNLVMNDGTRVMDAMVTAFPIKVGDRVQMGFMKVYRDRDAQGKVKKLDPENAGIVLMLNTDFLGPSMIHIRTHQRELNCTIEVENARKKKTLDRFLGELSESLKTTSFDLRDVQVRVRRRKTEKTDGETGTKEFTSIDMRV